MAVRQHDGPGPQNKAERHRSRGRGNPPRTVFQLLRRASHAACKARGPHRHARRLTHCQRRQGNGGDHL